MCSAPDGGVLGAVAAVLGKIERDARERFQLTMQSPTSFSPARERDGAGNESPREQIQQVDVEIAPRDGWVFKAAVMDLATGRATRISLNYSGYILQSGWANDRPRRWRTPASPHPPL